MSVIEDLEEYTSTEKCDCGRFWCDYFNASWNQSFDRDEIEDQLNDLKKNGLKAMKNAISYLEKLLEEDKS